MDYLSPDQNNIQYGIPAFKDIRFLEKIYLKALINFPYKHEGDYFKPTMNKAMHPHALHFSKSEFQNPIIY